MSLDPALPLASPRVLSAKPLGARYLAIYCAGFSTYRLPGRDSFDSPLSATPAASVSPSAAVTSTLGADSLLL